MKESLFKKLLSAFYLHVFEGEDAIRKAFEEILGRIEPDEPIEQPPTPPEGWVIDGNEKRLPQQYEYYLRNGNAIEYIYHPLSQPQWILKRKVKRTVEIKREIFIYKDNGMSYKDGYLVYFHPVLGDPLAIKEIPITFEVEEEV